MELNHYKTLSKVSTKGMTEEKNGLTYLTWSKAFDELLKLYPDATYEIVKFDGKPYYMDESGAMVFTNMTIEGIKREMFLPVLDGANKPMKEKEYKYKGYGWVQGQKTVIEKTCDAVNMFDINKALMRCLVKNIAMFGLGLNIYAGEDLPLGDETEKSQPVQPVKSHLGTCSVCGTTYIEGPYGPYCPKKKSTHDDNKGYMLAPVNNMKTPF